MSINKKNIEKALAYALFQVEESPATRKKYLSHLNEILSHCESDERIKVLLTSPIFTWLEKQEFFLLMKVPRNLKHFLEIVSNQKMLDHLSSIINTYEELLFSSLKKVKAKITVSSKPETSQEIKLAFEKKLKEITKKDAILDFDIMPSILGGYIIKTNELYIDSSLKKNLETIKNQFRKQ